MKMSKLMIVFFITVFTVFFTGCSDEKKDNAVDSNLSINSCEGCHTNYSVLKEIAKPDTIVESAGCGGDAPHIEPYDRVYLDEENGFLEFTLCGSVIRVAIRVMFHCQSFKGLLQLSLTGVTLHP